MQNTTQLCTERLFLRGISPSSIHELFSTKTKTEIISFFGVDELGYEHYKNMHENGMETNRLSLFVFLLIDKQTNLPIGECGFHTWNNTHRRAELFYTLRTDVYKQKGYMTEALKVVLEYGFTKMKLHRIQALVGAENTASIKLLQRYNFVKEGIMREDYCVDGMNEDSTCYSLLKREWDSSEALRLD